MAFQSPQGLQSLRCLEIFKLFQLFPGSVYSGRIGCVAIPGKMSRLQFDNVVHNRGFQKEEGAAVKQGLVEPLFVLVQRLHQDMRGLAKELGETLEWKEDEDGHPVEDVMHDRHGETNLELFRSSNLQKGNKSRGDACPNVGSHDDGNRLLHADASRSYQRNNERGDRRRRLHNSGAKGSDEDSHSWVGEVLLGQSAICAGRDQSEPSRQGGERAEEGVEGRLGGKMDYAQSNEKDTHQYGE